MGRENKREVKVQRDRQNDRDRYTEKHQQCKQGPLQPLCSINAVLLLRGMEAPNVSQQNLGEDSYQLNF